MGNTLITCLQLAGIGLVFGFSGPCFLTCTPAVLALANAAGYERRQALWHFALFAAGRLLAYALLGVIAGISAHVLEQALGHAFFLGFRAAAAVVCGALSVSLFFERVPNCLCRAAPALETTRTGSFVLLGFLLGVVPCIPMVTLLGEIMLMSTSIPAAAGYTLCVGVGTVTASAVFFGTALGLAWAAPGFLRQPRPQRYLRLVSAALLLAFAILLLLQIALEGE